MTTGHVQINASLIFLTIYHTRPSTQLIHCSASEYSHFQTCLGFWLHVAPVKISPCYLNRFKRYNNNNKQCRLWLSALEIGMQAKVGNRLSKLGHARPSNFQIIRYVRDRWTDRWTDTRTYNSNAYCPSPTVRCIIIIYIFLSCYIALTL